MPSTTEAPTHECTCMALRQAARHITQFYDLRLAPTGLRTTQFSILAKLQRLGPLTINALARQLAIDRTTLGRTMLPLQRSRLITIMDGKRDRRSKELHLTQAGAERLRAARKPWTEAQQHLAAAFGAERTLNLRNELHALASSDLGILPKVGKSQRKSARAAHDRP
jgi:DNA-binding MarR family transcriptional regulator